MLIGRFRLPLKVRLRGDYAVFQQHYRHFVSIGIAEIEIQVDVQLPRFQLRVEGNAGSCRVMIFRLPDELADIGSRGSAVIILHQPPPVYDPGRIPIDFIEIHQLAHLREFQFAVVTMHVHQQQFVRILLLGEFHAGGHARTPAAPGGREAEKQGSVRKRIVPVGEDRSHGGRLLGQETGKAGAAVVADCHHAPPLFAGVVVACRQGNQAVFNGWLAHPVGVGTHMEGPGSAHFNLHHPAVGRYLGRGRIQFKRIVHRRLGGFFPAGKNPQNGAYREQ